MKHVLLILLLPSISMAHLSISDKVDVWEAAVEPYVEICKTESGVNPLYPERMKFLEFPDEKNFRCYMKCLYENMEVMDDTGVIDIAKFASQLTHGNVDLAEECKGQVREETDLCELAYKLLLCTVHPFFKFTPQADRFDVAVLRLDRTAHQLPHITPICLPPRGENFLGEVGVAAGWGALSPGSRLRPQTLQAVPVPVLENRVCERWHRSKGIGVTIYDEMLCAGYKNGGRDSCQGDSGGPLMLLKQGRWYLIGIVSAGYSCAQPGQPGIYHRVAHTVDWITRAIGA